MRPEEFEQAYAEHAASLLAYLTYRTGDPALADDLVAQTFEKVLRARSRFDRRRASVKTWIYTIALNTLRDHARARGAEQRAMERAVAAVPVPPLREEAVDLQDAIARAMASLPDKEREVIALRYGADLTVPEVARVLGEPVTTIEGRAKRGLARLRDELGG